VVQAGAGRAMARQASAAVKPETAGPHPKIHKSPFAGTWHLAGIGTNVQFGGPPVRYKNGRAL
jgi:hypothetical protein